MDKLVKLASFHNPNEAHILKGLLSSEGIEAFIFDEMSATFIPAFGGVRLMVKQSDLERAREIIKP